MRFTPSQVSLGWSDQRGRYTTDIWPICGRRQTHTEFWWGDLKEEGLILKWILNKSFERAWTQIYLTEGRKKWQSFLFFWQVIWSLRYINRREILWVAERPLASRSGLFAVELVIDHEGFPDDPSYIRNGKWHVCSLKMVRLKDPINHKFNVRAWKFLEFRHAFFDPVKEFLRMLFNCWYFKIKYTL